MANTYVYVTVTAGDAIVMGPWNIKMRSDVASQLGLASSPFPTAPLWPYGSKNMRMVRAKGNTRGNSIRVIVPSDSWSGWGALYSTFTWVDGQTYTVTEMRDMKIPTRI